MKRWTSTPSFAKASGSAPETSASPPVLAYGVASEVAKTTVSFFFLPASGLESGFFGIVTALEGFFES
jgi:hypothetical protein